MNLIFVMNFKTMTT